MLGDNLQFKACDICEDAIHRTGLWPLHYTPEESTPSILRRVIRLQHRLATVESDCLTGTTFSDIKVRMDGSSV